MDTNDQTHERTEPQAPRYRAALIWSATSIVIALGVFVFNGAVLDRSELQAKKRASMTMAEGAKILDDVEHSPGGAKHPTFGTVKQTTVAGAFSEISELQSKVVRAYQLKGEWRRDAVAFLGYRDWIRLLLWVGVVCALASVLYCLRAFWKGCIGTSGKSVVMVVALALVVSFAATGMREVREYRLANTFRFPTAGLVAANDSLQKHWLREGR